MNRRTLRKAIGPKEARNIVEAVHFASKIGRPLNTTITLHPNLLEDRPVDLGRFFGGFLNHLRIWVIRAGLPYCAVWVRENYEGGHREHIHVLLYLRHDRAGRTRSDLEAALQTWFPEHGAVHVGVATYRKDSVGRSVNQAMTYMLKQITPQARYALQGSVRREQRDRHTDASVAAVMGKRCGVSRSIDLKARQAENVRRSPPRNVVGLRSASASTSAELERPREREAS